MKSLEGDLCVLVGTGILQCLTANKKNGRQGLVPCIYFNMREQPPNGTLNGSDFNGSVSVI